MICIYHFIFSKMNESDDDNILINNNEDVNSKIPCTSKKRLP